MVEKPFFGFKKGAMLTQSNTHYPEMPGPSKITLNLRFFEGFRQVLVSLHDFKNV
jgi:hypothetical protein